MIGATVCSGIGAPEVAMPHWTWAFASEIEDAPRAIMKYRHGAEDVRQPRAGTGPALWADFTAIRVRFLRKLRITLPQWLVAGTPCQSFSIAGLRGGMSDARGNLTMEFLRLVHALRRAGSLRGFLWENVPGILSHADNPFGCFLAGIVGSDTPIVSPLQRGRWPSAGMVDGPFGKAAWRVSDAQYFGLAQRRARVILVASFVEGIDPAAVLFERHGLSGHPASRREARQVAPTIPSRSTGGGGLGTGLDCDGGLIHETAPCLTASFGSKLGLDNQHIDSGAGMFVTHSLRSEGFDASEDGTGRGTPLVPVAFDCKASGQNGFGVGEVMSTLRSMGHKDSHTDGGGHASVEYGSAVRRLMPVECERLQGYPDHFTAIPYRWRKIPADEAALAEIDGAAVAARGGDLITDCMADGPRYKVLGNSMPVTMIRFYLDRVERQAA